MTRSLADAIGATPALAGLERDVIELVSDCAELAHFDRGELLLREGELADRFFLIERGTLALEVHHPGHGPVHIDTLGPGRLVGLSWIAPPFRSAFDVRATDEVVAIGVDAARLRARMHDRPDLGLSFLERLVGDVLGRLQTTRIRLLDLYGHVPRT